MFVADEVLLDLRYAAARERLARLVEDGGLLAKSQAAYTNGGVGLERVGTTRLSKLVTVQTSELASASESNGVAIRWQAAGPGGGLFPVLDADVILTPADDRHTLLTLTGVYRPPLGGIGARLDRVVLHRLAAATIRNFIGRLAEDISDANGPAEAAAAGPRQGRTAHRTAVERPLSSCRLRATLRTRAGRPRLTGRKRGFRCPASW
jgi:hypothetical protein